MICGDERLSRQDKRTAELYRARLAEQRDEQERVRLEQAHEDWRRERDQECLRAPEETSWGRSRKYCLEDAFATRLRDLAPALDAAEIEGLNLARALLWSDPLEAASVLERMTSVPARMELLLILHAFGEPGQDRDRRISALQAGLEAEIEPALDPYEFSAFGPPVPYDGSDAAVIWLAVAASSTMLVNDWPSFLSIPCPVLRRRPGLLDATAPRFSGSRDNFLPRSGCAWNQRADEEDRWRREEAAITAVRSFIDRSKQADGNFLATHSGSARFWHAAHLAQQVEIARLDPWRLLADPQLPSQRPYETWSYLSVANQRTFKTLSSMYDEARRVLSDYYVADFGMAEEDAARAAARGLINAVNGADCGRAPPPPSFRRLILDGAPVDEVQAFIKEGGWRDAKGLTPFWTCARHAGADPLIHLAVTRPELLDLLEPLSTSLPESERRRLDLEFTSAVTNPFGKTPLMAAAQWNRLASIDWLLARGAAVNDRTDAPKIGWEMPEHGERTALMYAAANGSLAVIERLLAAGADKALTDTQGRTALDYLTGRGPVPANPVLTPAERKKAEALLR